MYMFHFHLFFLFANCQPHPWPDLEKLLDLDLKPNTTVITEINDYRCNILMFPFLKPVNTRAGIALEISILCLSYKELSGVVLLWMRFQTPGRWCMIKSLPAQMLWSLSIGLNHQHLYKLKKKFSSGTIISIFYYQPYYYKHLPSYFKNTNIYVLVLDILKTMIIYSHIILYRWCLYIINLGYESLSAYRLLP